MEPPALLPEIQREEPRSFRAAFREIIPLLQPATYFFLFFETAA